MTDYSITDWEGRLLDSVFHGVPFRVENAYIGLATVNQESTPYTYYELTTSDYNRKRIEWNTASGGAITNSNQIVWTPTTNWGTVPSAFLSDVAQGGTMLLVGSISLNTGAGSQIILEPGALTVT